MFPHKWNVRSCFQLHLNAERKFRKFVHLCLKDIIFSIFNLSRSISLARTSFEKNCLWFHSFFCWNYSPTKGLLSILVKNFLKSGIKRKNENILEIIFNCVGNGWIIELEAGRSGMLSLPNKLLIKLCYFYLTQYVYHFEQKI